MSMIQEKELHQLISATKFKLARLKNLVNWLHTSDYAYGYESYLSYDHDSIIEQAELILRHAENVATHNPDKPKTDRDINIQILAIRRFSPQLSDCYDELEYFHLIRREDIEGNPFAEKGTDFKNNCETAWFDELACANGVHARDDTI